MPEPPAKQLSGIFVCYRRDDSSGHAGRLFDKLGVHFGEDRIFMDIEAIKPGADFVRAIEDSVGRCDILIAIIGRHWLSAAGQTSLLLDNPDDFVRLEIATAIELDVSIVPVLVHSAMMPKPRDLPNAISGLSRLNAIELSDLRWRHDVDQLIRSLERLLGERYEFKRNVVQETRRRKEIDEERRAVEERLRKLAESRRQAEEQLRLLNEEAQLRAEQEQQLSVAVGVLREQEDEWVRRNEEIQARLAAQVKACYVAELEAQQHEERTEAMNIEFETALQNERDAVTRLEETKNRLRSLEEMRNGTQVGSQRRAERENQLNAEIEALRRAEEEQIKRIEVAEARLREQEETRQMAKSRVKELAEREHRLVDEIEELRKTEAGLFKRINETEARLPAHKEAVRQAQAQAQRIADEELELLSQKSISISKWETKTRRRGETYQDSDGRGSKEADASDEQSKSPLET